MYHFAFSSRSRSLSERRSAVGMLEILVVIAILGVLTAILLPAILAMRDKAKKVECLNNLRQLGIAFHQYLDQHGEFPPAMFNEPSYYPNWPGVDPTYPWLSWRGYLLPYLSQDVLWARTQDAFKKDRNPWNSPVHQGLTTIVSSFWCPADGRLGITYNELGPTGTPVTTAALSSYLGVNGTDLLKRDGTLFFDQGIRREEITDGMSTTLLVGERPPPEPKKFGWWYVGVGQFIPRINKKFGANYPMQFAKDGIFSGSLAQSLGAAELNTGASGYPQFDNCDVGPHSYQVGSLSNPCDAFHYWSFHKGGANFLFSDGAACLLNYSIRDDLVKLSTRAGGEIVPEY